MLLRPAMGDRFCTLQIGYDGLGVLLRRLALRPSAAAATRSLRQIDRLGVFLFLRIALDVMLPLWIVRFDD